MKKSLLALAALAVCGVASAQSSVTLYGVVDVNVGSTKTTDASGVSVSNTVQNSGGYNGSRWGLRGTEDLGGGLSAKFQVESGFTADDGNVANGATMFGRQAYAGLEGGFGSVTAGRQYSAYDSLRAGTNQAYDSSFAVTGSVFGNGVADYTARVNNSVMYTSPTMGGLSGQLMYAFGENKAAATATAAAVTAASSLTSLHVKYAAGPLLVGVGYQGEKSVATAAAPSVTTKHTLVAGSYDAGVVKVTAGYQTSKAGTSEDTEMQIGVNAPISANANVALGYATSQNEVAGVDGNERTGFVLTGYYDLSKRTRAYAATNNTKTKNAAGATTAKTATSLAVGVRHSF